MSEVPTTDQQNGTAGDAGGKASRQKPAKTLPTDRIRLDKQHDILRAFAAASGHERKPVTTKEVGTIVDMAESTIGQITPFFVDIGLIVREKKAESKGFIPAPEVTAYQKAYEWDKVNAFRKVAPILTAAWFTDALMPKLKFRPVNEKEAVNDLADIASVGPEKEVGIRTIIDYLVAAGIVERDANGMLRVGSDAPVTPAASPAQSPHDRPIPPASVPPAPTNTSVQHQLWLLEILNAYPDLTEEDENAILKLIKTIKAIKNAPPVSE